jgi:hypothetical protein
MKDVCAYRLYLQGEQFTNLEIVGDFHTVNKSLDRIHHNEQVLLVDQYLYNLLPSIRDLFLVYYCYLLGTGTICNLIAYAFQAIMGITAILVLSFNYYNKRRYLHILQD